MTRGYETDMGLVVVENMLESDSDEVQYVGYLVDKDGNVVEHSHRQLQPRPKRNEHQMRLLRRYVVERVLTCYRLHLHQQGQCNKRRRVMFSNFVKVKKYIKDPKVSREEKVRGWIEFGNQMRQQGLCSPDTTKDLLEDALTCRMPR